jgi:hypothetical protein
LSAIGASGFVERNLPDSTEEHFSDLSKWPMPLWRW